MSCYRCPPQMEEREIQQLIAEQLALETDQVSEGEAASRLAVCESCDHLIDAHTCGLCGCYIHFRIRLASKTCPANKGW